MNEQTYNKKLDKILNELRDLLELAQNTTSEAAIKETYERLWHLKYYFN
jgi:hypothetical protein